MSNLLNNIYATAVRNCSIQDFTTALKNQDRIKAFLHYKDLLLTNKIISNKDTLSLLNLLTSDKNTYRHRVVDQARNLSAIKFVLSTINNPNITHYESLFKYHAKKLDFEQIRVLILDIEKKSIPLTIDIFNLLISMYFKSSLQSALDFIQKIEIEPNNHTFDIILSGLVKHKLYDQASKYAQSITTYSSTTFVEMMRLSSVQGNHERVDSLFKESISVGKADHFTCSALLESLSLRSKSPEYDHAQLLDRVEQLIVLVDEQGIRKDAHIMQTFIKLYIQLNNLSSAFKIYDQLAGLSIYPSVVINHTILHGCFSLNQIDQGIEFIAMMQSQGLEVTMLMYRTALQGLVDKDGDFEMIMNIYDQIRGLNPVTAIYNIVLGACVRKFDLQNFTLVWHDLTAKAKVPTKALLDTKNTTAQSQSTKNTSLDPKNTAQSQSTKNALNTNSRTSLKGSKEVVKIEKSKPNQISLQTAIEMAIACHDPALARKLMKDCKPLIVPRDSVLKLLKISLDSRAFNDSLHFLSLLDFEDGLGECIEPYKQSFDNLILQPFPTPINQMAQGAGGSDWRLKTKTKLGGDEKPDAERLEMILALYRLMYKSAIPPLQIQHRLLVLHHTNLDLISVIKTWGALIKSHTPAPQSTSILLQSCVELGGAKTSAAVISSVKEEWMDIKCKSLLCTLEIKFGDCRGLPRLVVGYVGDGGNLSILWASVARLVDSREAEVQARIYDFFEECFPEVL